VRHSCFWIAGSPLFLNLPLSTMDRLALKKELDDIGRH
jgi:hypothetical protein